MYFTCKGPQDVVLADLTRGTMQGTPRLTNATNLRLPVGMVCSIVVRVCRRDVVHITHICAMETLLRGRGVYLYTE